MTRIPLLAGPRVVIANAPDNAVVLRPPAPADAVDDVAAAAREALRFPLTGPRLESVLPRGARVTIVIEPPTLPIPGSDLDPRQAALAGTVDELVRIGVPVEAQTLLVAGGLARRLGRETPGLVSPDFARRFHGRLVVHDVEDEHLVEVGSAGRVPLRVNRALVETDAVVVVSAAESILHGGPATLLGAAGSEALRAAGAFSLLEAAGSQGWQVAVALERELARRAPVVGVSLVLNHPRLAGAFYGYPYDVEADERLARSAVRRLFGLLPPPVRGRIMRSLPRELTISGAFGGPPSVAHAEALLRAIDAREAVLEEQVDAICIGIPPTTPYLPRERPNPLLVAYLALGLALRLWRDDFPVAEGGTVILLHRFHRHFAHPTQQPYRAFFGASRFGVEDEELAAAERAATSDPRALEAYREGRACHPALPFRDWAACQPALGRVGAVIVAGCRDSVAARQLDFVPTHGLGAALTLARGRTGRAPRVGFLLSPPYFPIRVGAA